MNNEQTYTIEQINVQPMNLNAEDIKDIEQTVFEHALGTKKGVTEIDVFKGFALELEHTFGARISVFNYPSEELNYWTIILPKDGDFDTTQSKISVMFQIKPVNSP